jgi:uncharacterized membrane protein
MLMNSRGGPHFWGLYVDDPFLWIIRYLFLVLFILRTLGHLHSSLGKQCQMKFYYLAKRSLQIP